MSEHTIEEYFDFSYSIHADVNKRQITEGKNATDSIEEERRGNIPRMINLRFWIRALPSNPKSEGKQTVSTVLKNCVFTFHPLKEKNITPGFYLDFVLFLSFCLIKEYRYLNLVDPSTAVQSLFLLLKYWVCRRPCIWGGKLAGKLCWI